MNKVQDLKKLCKWLNSLPEEEQLNILSYITDKTEVIKLDQAEANNFSELVNSIIQLILEGKNSESIKVTLESYELNKLFINPLLSHCQRASRPFFDANIAKVMDTDKLSSICEFVLDDMILYNEVNGPAKIAELLQIEVETAKRAMSFIYNCYMKVCSRENTPSTLKIYLKQVHYFSDEHLEAFMQPLLQNLSEAKQAYMLDKIDVLLEKVLRLTEVNEDE